MLFRRSSSTFTDWAGRQIIFASFFSSGGLAVAVTSAMITILAQLNGVISVTLPFWLEVVGWWVPRSLLCWASAYLFRLLGSHP